MNFWGLLDESTSLRALTVLGHFVWQGTAVGLLLLILLRLLRRA
jgi:hypothetical protein